ERRLRYRRLGRLALDEGREIVDHQLAHGIARVYRRGADVRQQGDVVELQERRVDVRLAHVDVEAGSHDGAVLQRRDQGFLVHHRAARHVDQNAARSERLQYGGVDQLGGAGTTGRDDDQRVDVARHGQQVGIVAMADVALFVAAEIADRQAERLAA